MVEVFHSMTWQNTHKSSNIQTRRNTETHEDCLSGSISFHIFVSVIPNISAGELNAHSRHILTFSSMLLFVLISAAVCAGADCTWLSIAFRLHKSHSSGSIYAFAYSAPCILPTHAKKHPTLHIYEDKDAKSTVCAILLCRRNCWLHLNQFILLW